MPGPANRAPLATRHTRFNAVQLSTANTSRTAPKSGAYGILLDATGVQNGVRIDLIRAVCTAAVTNGVVRIFIENKEQTFAFLVKEILMTTTTPSTTVEVEVTEYQPTDAWVIPEGWRILCTTNGGDTINVFIHAEDFEAED